MDPEVRLEIASIQVISILTSYGSPLVNGVRARARGHQRGVVIIVVITVIMITDMVKISHFIRLIPTSLLRMKVIMTEQNLVVLCLRIPQI